MSSQHAAKPRGLAATRSPLFQGRFGRMFRNLAPAQFGKNEQENIDNLTALAAKMVAVADPPKDGPDAEESGIPALYTYFGQFADHDITFDPVSVLTKSRDPDGLVDYRTPALDLDNVYGRGPGDQPYLYDDNGLFQLGEALTGADADARDLPRFRGRALIGDPRNDENAVVSQLQGLFLRFHNRMAGDNKPLSFERIQRRVRFHYQYVVLNDFLPRIIAPEVLDALKTDGRFDRKKLSYFHWRHEPFMPVEFSVGAYRLGHSMIRPGYRLNDNDESLVPIFPPKGQVGGMTGFSAVGPGRALDWGRFIDVDVRPYGGDGDANADANKRRLQYAYRLDTSLVGPLGELPAAVASNPASLALRNLERAWRLGLPSGQAVARAMGVTPLLDEEILIGKAVEEPDPGEEPVPIVAALGPAGAAFAGNCPLWTYVLAEATRHKRMVKVAADGGPEINTPQLGPVGGRIVAEVFLGLMFGDNASMLSLNPNWTPTPGGAAKADFELKDFVSYALGKGPALG